MNRYCAYDGAPFFTEQSTVTASEQPFAPPEYSILTMLNSFLFRLKHSDGISMARDRGEIRTHVLGSCKLSSQTT